LRAQKRVKSAGFHLCSSRILFSFSSLLFIYFTLLTAIFPLYVCFLPFSFTFSYFFSSHFLYFPPSNINRYGNIPPLRRGKSIFSNSYTPLLEGQDCYGMSPGP
jgi:hypothetical protein